MVVSEFLLVIYLTRQGSAGRRRGMSHDPIRVEGGDEAVHVASHSNLIRPHPARVFQVSNVLNNH